MKQQINKWLKNNQLLNLSHLKQISFKHFIFKPSCLLCEGNVDAPRGNIHAVCRACLSDLPRHASNSCPQCGLESSGIVCGSCINSPPDFDATCAVFLYQFPIDAMMVRYKYGSSLNIGDIFGQFLAEKVSLENIDVIVPMPMHPQRLKERGFNQAHEIAKILAKNCIGKLDFKSAERIKFTPPQASLPLKERVKNIKGVFKMNINTPNQIQGKRVAIVDDVMTTGASLNELAKTLKKAGARHIECWVIARTLPHQ